MSLVRHNARHLARPLGRNLVSVSTVYDVDALSFFARAGVVSASEKLNVSDFIKGMKAPLINKWSGVFNAWTLRSTQNAGTASILYGLKAGNDGAISGAAWGASETAFDGTDDFIDIANPANVFKNATVGYLVCVYRRASGSGNALFVSNGTNSAQGRASILSGNKGAQGRRLDSDGSATSTAGSVDTSRHYGEGRYDWSGNSIVSVVDGVAGSSVAFGGGAGSTSNTDPLKISIGANGGGTAGFLVGGVSFAMIMATLPTLSEAEAIRALYKSTIGQGLGLP